MKISMYEASVPPFIHALENLAAILGKAAAHCEAKKIDESVLLNARLYPDMFPLAKQVQIAADAAKGGSGRLAQVEPPAFEDNEASFADLVARIGKTVTFLKTLKAAQFEGAEDRTCTWKTRKGEKSMQGMPTCSRTCCPTSTSTSPPPTRSCGTTASRSASGISSAIREARGARSGPAALENKRRSRGNAPAIPCSNGSIRSPEQPPGRQVLAPRQSRFPSPPEKNMLNELRTQRVALSLEVDRARKWRSTTALDKIRQGLEARLTLLDKEIKAETEKAPA